MGNDLAGEKVIASPHMLKDPEKLPHTAVEDQAIYPACAVTRVMARRMLTEESNEEERSSEEADVASVRNNITESNTESKAECPLNLAETFVGHNLERSNDSKALATPGSNSPIAGAEVIPKDLLIKLQASDPDLCDIQEKVVSETEAPQNQVSYFKGVGR